MVKNPLLDIDFLNQLTLNKDRETYVRITALTKDELPVEYIEGKVTGGSINIDGTSCVRRTCSLSMIANDVNINDYYWGLKNKFKLEIGIKNMINSNYPNIIWFKQGLFIITSFSTSQSANSFTINISGKDKMCLLNGDLSGVLPHSTDFGIEEFYDKDTGVTTYTSIPIKRIIREAVQNFGGELSHNIIINDLDEAGLMLLEYRGDQPIYMLYDITKGAFTNISTRGSMKCYVYNKEFNAYEGPYHIDNREEKITYDVLSDMVDKPEPSIIVFNNGDAPLESGVKYHLVKIEYGMIPGYRLTDLTYAGDLIANVGESLTSILDKIKNMLGDFEYFYDIDGHFIFRKRLNYVSSPWNTSESGDLFIDPAAQAKTKIFNFTNGHLITSFSNTPNLLNLRNDYSVWGKYKTTAGAEIPIHMRYAVDKKPTEYLPIRPLKKKIETSTVLENGGVETLVNYKYFNAPSQPPYDDIMMVSYTGDWESVNEKVQQRITEYYAIQPFTSENYDWRELIYQMALDYRQLSHDDDYIYKMNQKNILCANGKTGYESYYTDIEGFWRDLYNPDPELKLVTISAEAAANEDIVYVQGFAKVPKSEANYDNIDKYYVLAQADDAEVENNPLTFYPFKRGYCRLEHGAKYYFMTSEGEMNQGTFDEEILKETNIDSIYVEDGVDEEGNKKFIKYTEVRFHKAVSLNALYIIKDKISFDDMIKNTSIKDIFETYPQTIYYKDTDNYGAVKNELDFSIPILYYGGYYDFYTIKEIENKKAEVESIEEKESIDNLLYWRKDVLDSPETLIFWFDFLDAEGSDLAKYGVAAVGTRSKAINDGDVKTIYYRDIPNMIFLSGDDKTTYDTKSGYTYTQLPSYMENLFVTSSKGKSAKERIDELLYDHLFCAESANISSIPVYHLEPNGKVFIKDDKSGINGEYIISKITLPLAYNGTMSLTATKTVPSDMLIF